MLNRIFVLCLVFIAGQRIALAAGTSLEFESALGYTTNADLASEGAVSDGILRVGGYAGFPLSNTQARASIRFADYMKRDANDLLSIDLGTKWALDSKDKSARSFDVRFVLRDYVHEEVGTTDVGFTHYGVIGRYGWNSSFSGEDVLRISPQVDVEHYTKFSNRNDIDLSIRFEKESLFDFEFTPGLLLSTESDFSKVYLFASANYEKSIDDVTTWGAFLSLTPSLYTSRETDSVVLATGRRRNLTSMSIRAKETTLLISPGVWWSRELSPLWEFRADSFLSRQTSKSGTYDYTELQAAASIRYRAL